MSSILNPNRNFSIEVRGKVFFGLIPYPATELEIDVAVSRRTGGLAIPATTYHYALMLETIPRVLTKLPESYMHITDWGQVFDTDLVLEIYEAYRRAREQFFSRLKKKWGA